jgi:hypothetical protein
MSWLAVAGAAALLCGPPHIAPSALAADRAVAAGALIFVVLPVAVRLRTPRLELERATDGRHHRFMGAG